ncbi:hypothetical protein ACXWSA_09970, partial [Streptococcus pyogenes]
PSPPSSSSSFPFFPSSLSSSSFPSLSSPLPLFPFLFPLPLFLSFFLSLFFSFFSPFSLPPFPFFSLLSFSSLSLSS